VFATVLRDAQRQVVTHTRNHIRTLSETSGAEVEFPPDLSRYLEDGEGQGRARSRTQGQEGNIIDFNDLPE